MRFSRWIQTHTQELFYFPYFARRMLNHFLKFSLLLPCLCCSQFCSQAQISTEYVSLGYLGKFLIQPGIQVGAQVSVKELPAQASFPQIEHSLFFYPQMGWYSRPGLVDGTLPQIDVGYLRKRADKQRYASASVGLGYLFQDSYESVVIDLSNGEDRVGGRVRDYAWVVLANLEYGFRMSDELRLYTRVGAGPKFYREQADSFTLFVGTGLKFHLK